MTAQRRNNYDRRFTVVKIDDDHYRVTCLSKPFKTYESPIEVIARMLEDGHREPGLMQNEPLLLGFENSEKNSFLAYYHHAVRPEQEATQTESQEVSLEVV